jgi:hypothetical protein
MSRVVRHTIRKDNGACFTGDEIFLRQGDLDGACGPYCLAMALIGLELTTKIELTGGYYHGNSKIARLIRNLEIKNPYFFRAGTTKKDLEAAIQASFHKSVEVDYFKGTGREFRDFANLFVKDGDPVWPVILGMNFGKNADWGHWVLIIGHEQGINGESHYLILDPSGNPPKKNECWNAKIQAVGTGSPLPYQVTQSDGTEYRIALTDAVGFIPKQP